MRSCDAFAAAILDRKIGYILAAKRDCAGARLVGPGENVEQRCLAGAVRTDDANRFSFTDDEVDLVQNDERVETLVDGARRQNRYLRRCCHGFLYSPQ
jgi:hypothetical protein